MENLPLVEVDVLDVEWTQHWEQTFNGYSLDLPFRVQKPRLFGRTAITDVGMPVGEVKTILADHHDFVDFAKFGIGSAYILKNIKQKIAAYQQYDIPVCFGGTLFEKFYHQNKVEDYILFLKGHGINWIELSFGTIDISTDDLSKVVEQVIDDFSVIVEVGKKDNTYVPDPVECAEQITMFRELGVKTIILEGRGSGDAGFFDQSGQLRRDIVLDLLARVDSDNLVFEAPNASAQLQLIELLGPNVNMGNVDMRDLVNVECMRQGLKSETFHIVNAYEEKSHRKNLKNSNEVITSLFV